MTSTIHTPGMDLDELVRLGKRLERIRAQESEVLDAIAAAVLAAHPKRRKLLTAEKATGVPRTTIRRRIRAAQETNA